MARYSVHAETLNGETFDECIEAVSSTVAIIKCLLGVLDENLGMVTDVEASPCFEGSHRH